MSEPEKTTPRNRLSVSESAAEVTLPIPTSGAQADRPTEVTLVHELLRTDRDQLPSESPSHLVLGNYELLEEIARGGMGVVYKARHRDLNRIVAVKTMLSGQLHVARTGVRGERSCGRAFRHFLMGGILYAMLAGSPPFRGNTPLDVLIQVLENEPRPLSGSGLGIPKQLAWICHRCLEKNPARRYPSAKELAEDLDRYLRGDEVVAQPDGLARQLKRWGRREPYLVAHLGALLLVFLVVQLRYFFAPPENLKQILAADPRQLPLGTPG